MANFTPLMCQTPQDHKYETRSKDGLSLYPLLGDIGQLTALGKISEKKPLFDYSMFDEEENKKAEFERRFDDDLKALQNSIGNGQSKNI